MRWLLIAWICLTPFGASAQLFESTEVAPRVHVSPESIQPLSIASLSLSPITEELRNSTIAWYRDGKLFLQGIGLLTATTSAGALGTKTEISVLIDGVDLGISATLLPTDISLLWSANSYVPPFYKGRALPGAGSTLHVEAFPVLVENGRAIPARDLVFNWSVNGTPRPSLSGNGRARVTVPPTLAGIRTLRVVASTKDGVLRAEKTISLPVVEPQPRLYREHPLFGTLFHHALPEQIVVADTDLELVLVPFFSQTTNARSLSYDWLINNSPAHISEALPNYVHLSSKGAGSAILTLTLTNSAQILEEAQRKWTVFLGERTGATQSL